jgi:hypothetical protein
MRVLMQLPVAELLDIDFPTIFGGHTGYGTGPTREPQGDEDGGGIGPGVIVAIVALTVVTIALLVWVSPSSTRARLKSFAPLALLVVIIAMPLIVWAASSGKEEESLIVERSTSSAGTPEFIVSLAEDDLNTLKMTNGRKAVRLQCFGREGQVVLAARQRWPFRSRERGYDYPHTHQAASAGQVQRADRCQLRGTRVRLETDVEGALTG